MIHPRINKICQKIRFFWIRIMNRTQTSESVDKAVCTSKLLTNFTPCWPISCLPFKNYVLTFSVLTFSCLKTQTVGTNSILACSCFLFWQNPFWLTPLPRPAAAAAAPSKFTADPDPKPIIVRPEEERARAGRDRAQGSRNARLVALSLSLSLSLVVVFLPHEHVLVHHKLLRCR